MSGLDHIIIDLALILIFAGVTTIIFKNIKQPVVLGYIVVGFLVGSNFQWFPTVVDIENIHIWADIGIVFLMFALGLEFSLQKLTKLGGAVILTTFTVVIFMILIGYAVGQLLGWSNMDSIFLGGMICISSTMIILKAFEEYDLKREKFASLVLGVLILEDLVAIFIMIILSTLAVSKGVSGIAMLSQISILLLYLVLWLALGIYLIPSILKKVQSFMNDETLLISSIGLCLGMVVIANKIGFSSALGAFIAGSILAGTVMAERIEKMIMPLRDLFGAIFFVSVGMLVDPEMIVMYLVPILVICVAVILGQSVFSGVGTLLSGQSLYIAVRTGFSFVQIGEFSFIIAALGSNLKVTSDFLYPVVVCVCVLTTFVTPITINNSERAYRLLHKILPNKALDFLERHTTSEKTVDGKDEDWKKYISRYVIRTIVCTAALFAIYVLSNRIMTPLIYRYVSHNLLATVVELVLAILLMTPFVSMMCSGRRKFLFVKLWVKNSTNRLPLLAMNGLRVAISVFFIALTCRSVYHVPILIVVLIAVIVVILVEKSEFIKGTTLTLETRFIANYNERTLAKAKKERGITGDHNWVDEQLFVSKFDVCMLPKKDAVREFYAKDSFGIYIIKIQRDEKAINMPHATDTIKIGDTVYAMGTKEQMESYTVMLEEHGHITNANEPLVTLREFIYEQSDIVKPEDQIVCCAIEIPKKSPLARKSIKNSNFRGKYSGYIIGIERGVMPIINIRRNLVIYEKDLLWVIGMQNMVDELIKDGLLTEE